MNDRRNDLTALKHELAECRSALRKLELRAQQAEGDQKAAYEAQLSTFRRRLIDVQEKLLEMTSGSEDDWADVKQEAGSMWKRFKRSLKDAKTEFKKGYDEGFEE